MQKTPNASCLQYFQHAYYDHLLERPFTFPAMMVFLSLF